MQIIEGYKGGSKKQHKPYEQPDNLRSTAKLKMLIALSEGEIEGGLTPQNIFIDKTPLANPDGTYNFNGVRWEFRNGSQTQDYIQGMPEVSNELKANFIVKTDKPWVRSFSNLDLDAVRIKLSLPAHIEYRDNGDMVGTVTNYAIDLSVDGSAFETVVNGKFDGKTTSEYQRDHRINLPNAIQGWTIRVRRITPDSTSGKLVNKFGVFSYAEVIDSKFRYPNTALLYVELDASEFNGSVPLVTCRLKGKIVQVPDNYDPVSRTHSGEWNGTFKMAYTNNPAWLTHYLMRDEIAGMGDKIESAMIDKWAIYQLAQYCDQMVSDGRGGKEPRFTCNEYIQSQRDAYTVLKDLVASFRGITFWGNDQIYLTADMPQDEPDFIYHPSNVVGDFVYAGGSYKNRYTSCMVAYSDPDNHYCDDVETVWDHDLMRRYDVNVMKLTAIGCTSQSEAQRRGRWALLSNVKDGVVTFTVGLDGYIPLPARIIGIADPSRSGKENGGRIHEVNGRKITLDRSVDYEAGDRLVINLPDGTAQSRTIKSISDDKRTITVTANYKIPPVVGAVWCIDSDNVAIQYYRVTGISARENQQFTITAIQHDPDKFKYIDDGVRLEPKPITVTPPSSISPPKNIIISESSYVSQGLSVASLEVSWDQVEGATNYVAQWRKDNCNWINVGQTNGTGFTVNGIYSGVYDVRVRAINAIEVSSPWAYSAAKSIKGKVGKPDKPINFTASDDVVFGINLNWSFPQGSSDTSHTEIQYSTNENEDNALLLSNVTYPSFSYSQTGLSIGQVFFYRARLVDKIGNTSDWTEWVRGISSTNANDLTDHILDEITGTDAWNSLIESTSSSVNSAIENAKSIIENALANDRETKRRRIENGKLSAEITETNAVLLNEKEATAIALKELKSNFGDVSSNLSELRQTTAEQNSATSKSIDSLTAKVGAVSSDLSQFKQVTTNQNSATAQAIQSINTTVGDVSTSISDVSKTVNNLDGKISAYRTMKIAVDNKGQQYVAGMTMGVENTDQGMQSNVIFLADKFMVMNQANGIPVPAFIVKDGNVIMNSAVFGHASINFATISDTIQSENYVPNKSGWKLFKNGTFEINSTFMDGGRVILNSDGLAVYDEMGVLRVLLGKLWR
ncbi:host specificity protein [Gilliamella apicola]|uniref:host specificity protein J n=1 Tax=Gilliamella apicola TaxID=1196095 RepID=UPI000A341C3E|nr:phage tail protein [Gilliamella apicola]OTP90477.1 host specificity protein [Gilliamella apicola]OTQ05751.1 host specificity protein [Gilliamella apicola]